MEIEPLVKQVQLKHFKDELIETLTKKNLITKQYEQLVESGLLDERISFLNKMIEDLEEELTE